MRDRKSDAHRTLTEQRLKRTLGPDDVVHHKSELKEDNSEGNLEVQTRSQHTILHNKTRQLGKLRKALSMPQRKERLY